MFKKDVHIGSIIEKLLRERQINVTSFARELGFDRKRIYYIFNSKSIDTDLLIQISKLLNYNLMLEYFCEENQTMKNIVLIEINNSKIAAMKSDPSIKIINSWPGV